MIELTIDMERRPKIDETHGGVRIAREQVYLVSLPSVTPANKEPKSYGTWTSSTPYFVGTGRYLIIESAPLSKSQSWSRDPQQRIPLMSPLGVFFYARQDEPFLNLGDFRTQALTCSHAFGNIYDYKLLGAFTGRVVYEAKYISDGNSAPPLGCQALTTSTSGKP